METTIVFHEDEATKLAALQTGINERALSFQTIRDDAHRNDALSFTKELKDVRGRVKAIFSDVIAQAHKLHKTLNDRMKLLDTPFADRETYVRGSISRYDDEQRERAETERRRVEAEQRKVEAERQRLQAEADAKARHEAETKRLEQAEALEAAGKAELAEKVLATPVYVEPVKVELPPPVPAYVPPPKAAGTRTEWKHRVLDVSLVPRQYLMVDDRLLATIARTQKEKASVLGVEFYPQSVTVAR